MAKLLATIAVGMVLLSGCDADLLRDTPGRMTSLSKSKLIETERRLEVSLDYGVGQLTVSPADPRVLYKLDLEYDANRVTPNFHYNASGDDGRLHLDFDSHRIRSARSMGRLDLNLTDTIPLDLKLRTGVSESKIDLSGLQLRRLDIEGGVGQTVLSFTKLNPIPCESIIIRSGVGDFRIVGLGNANSGKLLFEGGIGGARLDLTGAWQRNAELEMRLGIGEVTLIAPPEVGVEIEGHKRFLSSLHLVDFERFDDRYRSRNYDKSKYHLLVRVNTGIGSVRIRWA